MRYMGSNPVLEWCKMSLDKVIKHSRGHMKGSQLYPLHVENIRCCLISNLIYKKQFRLENCYAKSPDYKTKTKPDHSWLWDCFSLVLAYITYPNMEK